MPKMTFINTDGSRQEVEAPIGLSVMEIAHRNNVDLEGACALLNGEPHITSVDAMKVGAQYFVLQIGIGLDSLMIRDTDRQSKRRSAALQPYA